MGANAQTTVPTFTAGQVLTAAEMNGSARTGVPVFATTGTRDAAFGGTGEKTLAEGQMCYVEGTGFQTYNGTSWITWGTAPDVAGLTLISSTTIGTTVASVTVSDAFSATYDNYKIVVSGGVASTNNLLNLTLGSTATGYYRAGVRVTYASSTVNGFQSSNATSYEGFGEGTTTGLAADAEIFQPFAAKNTWFKNGYGANLTTSNYLNAAGFLNDTTSYTAFTLTCSTGTITGGTIKVYGYKN